jgi:chromosome partitioning protein
MHTITFANLKGGAGKTTTSWHTAIALDLAGQGPVATVDLDGQASFSNRLRTRARTRPSETLGLLEVRKLSELTKVHAAADKAGARWCIIDTPPAVTGASEAAIKLADLVVIPVKATLLDAEASLRTAQLCQASKKKFLFLLNEVSAKAQAMDVMSALASVGPVCPFILPRLVGFSSCMTDGLTLPELESTRPADVSGATMLGKVVRYLVGQCDGAKQLAA